MAERPTNVEDIDWDAFADQDLSWDVGEDGLTPSMENLMAGMQQLYEGMKERREEKERERMETGNFALDFWGGDDDDDADFRVGDRYSDDLSDMAENLLDFGSVGSKADSMDVNFDKTKEPPNSLDDFSDEGDAYSGGFQLQEYEGDIAEKLKELSGKMVAFSDKIEEYFSKMEIPAESPLSESPPPTPTMSEISQMHGLMKSFPFRTSSSELSEQAEILSSRYIKSCPSDWLGQCATRCPPYDEKPEKKRKVVPVSSLLLYKKPKTPKPEPPGGRLTCPPASPEYCDWLKFELTMGDGYESKDPILGLRALGNKYRSVFGQIRCVLIDMSGTLHVGKKYIHGGLRAVKLLRKHRIPYRFVTNTTKEPKSALLSKLESFNFPVKPDDICTSLTAARDFMDKHGLRPLLILEEGAKEDFEGMSQENLNAVCIGLSPTNFNYAMLNRAVRIAEAGVPLIGIHAGRYQEDPDGYLSLGPGPFVKALEFATGNEALFIGKPEHEFYSSVVTSLGFTLPEAVMIGDDARDDVGGALKCSMKGILVRTGKFRHGDEKKIIPLVPSMIAINCLTAVRAVVGAICVENDLSTGETDDEDEDGVFKPRKRYFYKGEEIGERVKARIETNACPPIKPCESKNPFKYDASAARPRYFEDLMQTPEDSVTDIYNASQAELQP